MTVQKTLACASAAGLATTACGQVATYSMALGTPSGPNNATLVPGQSIDVFVNVSFSPGLGQPFGNGAIAGLCNGAFSIMGSGAGRGFWTIDSNTASPGYSLPFPWGAQLVGSLGVSTGKPNGVSAIGVEWGTPLLLMIYHPSPTNPATVWRGTFTATTGGPGTLNFAFTEPQPTGVVTSMLLQTVVNFTSSPGVGGSITLIPGPATLALVLAGAMLAPRRRRSALRGARAPVNALESR